MAKIFNINKVNDGTSTGHIEAIFWLKETLVAAGWTVKASSNGTVYNATGDEWTTPADVNPASSWLRIADPADRRELLFKHRNVAGDDDWYVGYSSLDKFIQGTPSATATPTAADEAALWGTLAGQLTADMFGSTSQSHRIHVVAEDTPINGVYPFWIISHIQGGITPYFWMACDPLIPGTYPEETDPANPTVGDADPVVWSLRNSGAETIMSTGGNNIRTYTAWRGWFKYNFAEQEFVNFFGSDQGGFSNTLNRNPYNNNVEGFDVFWGRANSQPNAVGLKGRGAWIKWAGDTRAQFETVNLNAGAFLHIGSLLVPWPDNETLTL